MWKCEGANRFKEDAKLMSGMMGNWGEDCPNGGKRVYKGTLFDFINFMASADNFTYTLVESRDVCGECYDRYNCSGMTGMVNSGLVDFALGKKHLIGDLVLVKTNYIN